MSKYTPTIGLEIHAELKTRTKMFCDSKNDRDETRPNVNVCPVCLAHPGTLPVINREAVRHVLRVGAALRGTLADYTEFDRKNYFYPDLPKGYQISQWQHPLVKGGSLTLSRGSGQAAVAITRVHLEEDTASSIHSERDENTTVIDFNRAGMPLMELVTEPVIHDAQTAGAFARELQLLLRALGASDANMEKGEMRVEANVSVAPAAETFASADKRRPDADSRGKEKFLHNSASSQRLSAISALGTKVEIKNLNSFRAMERAVDYEIRRQTELLERGEKVAQETRGWDEKTQKTFSQRLKEESADYRYFPDPDLPSLRLSEIPEFNTERLRKDLPELPAQRRQRYVAMGVKPEDAAQFVREPSLGAFFEAVTVGLSSLSGAIALAANYIANDLVNHMRMQIRDAEERDSQVQEEIPISADHFRQIIELAAERKISSRSAKDLIKLSIEERRAPREIAEERKMLQEHVQGAVESVVRDIIEANPKVVADFRAGKETALQFLVGQAMKALRGSADPVELREMLRRAIEKGI